MQLCAHTHKCTWVEVNTQIIDLRYDMISYVCANGPTSPMHAHAHTHTETDRQTWTETETEPEPEAEAET